MEVCAGGKYATRLFPRIYSQPWVYVLVYSLEGIPGNIYCQMLSFYRLFHERGSDDTVAASLADQLLLKN